MSKLPDDVSALMDEGFACLDRKRTGLISHKDAMTLIRSAGVYVTEADMKAAIEEVDPVNSGTLDLPKCREMMASQLKKPNPAREALLSAFKLFDPDATGNIEVDDLGRLLMEMGDKYTSAEVEELMKMAEYGDDGLLQYEPFVDLLLATPLEGKPNKSFTKPIVPAAAAVAAKAAAGAKAAPGTRAPPGGKAKK